MNPSLINLGVITAAVIVFLYALRSKRTVRPFPGLEKTFATFAQNPWSLPLLALFFLTISAALALIFKLPEPSIHDEFAYLLQSDTFAHGRLANPPHPMFKFFENFHIIFHPTYASKYPPGQGLFLALGQMLGRPIIGVWISTALAGTATFWMLQSLFSKPWALAATLISFFNPQVLLWNWNFWGGSVAWLGGALAIGGALRFRKDLSARASIIMGLGMGILSLTRPYEGMLLSLVLLFICWRKGFGPFLTRCIVPAGCALLPFILFQCWYNYCVTDSPLKLPYNVYDAAYSQTATFVWQSRNTEPIVYHNPQMARMYEEWVYPEYDRQHTLSGFLAMLPGKIKNFSIFAWNGLLFATLLPLFKSKNNSTGCRLILWLLLAAVIGAFIGSVGAWPHYFAPAYPLLIAAIVFGLQTLSSWARQNRPVGLRLAWGVTFLMLSYGFILFSEETLTAEKSWSFKRAALQTAWEHDGKKHLVLVKYGPKHNFHEAWVWNRADINHAAVVWATDLGDGENRVLLDYFKNYQIEHVEPDDSARQIAH